MKWDNSNKTVLITGSSRSIGRAIAKSFAGTGCNIALNCIQNEAAMNDLIQEIKKTNPNVMGFKCDVSDFLKVGKMIEKIEKAFGGVDILINNAGISHTGLFQDMAERDWQRLFMVNVFGAFNTTKAVIPHMLSQKNGIIVNISSIWGEAGASCEAVYSASKAALNAFTEALAKELGPVGLRINAVSCGCIDTEMNNNLTDEEKASLAEAIPLMRFGTPKEIAEVVRFLASDSASYINGQIIRADGGFL